MFYLSIYLLFFFLDFAFFGCYLIITFIFCHLSFLIVCLYPGLSFCLTAHFWFWLWSLSASCFFNSFSCLSLTSSFSNIFSFKVSFLSQTSLISFISIFTFFHCLTSLSATVIYLSWVCWNFALSSLLCRPLSFFVSLSLHFLSTYINFFTDLSCPSLNFCNFLLPWSDCWGTF